MNSDLNAKVKNMSIKMFENVAIAEGKVHGKPLDEVHFHEVGATDSIVDIVGAAICLDYLKVDKIIASTINVGNGYVQCAHGLMPVPAPATAEILSQIPYKAGIVEGETTTPTGATIIKTNVNEFSNNKEFKVLKIGYGAGFKDFEVPNILRVYLGETNEDDAFKVKNLDLEYSEELLLETNIDDMNPEYFPSVEKQLFKDGALDVYRSNILMKKSRMAFKLSVLFKEENKDKIFKTILLATTTAGFRVQKIEKYMLFRETELFRSSLGDVEIKKLYLNGENIKSKIEYDDLEKIAEYNNISVLEARKILKDEV